MCSEQVNPIKPLSVIIPAYNASLYIRECISSVLGQPNYAAFLDIIIVIDGSTDDTLDVIKKAILGREAVVQIIVQNNMGLSAARNTGIAKVTSEYVTFLDADDVWHPDYLSTIIPLLDRGDVDLIEYDAFLLKKNSNKIGILKISTASSRCVKISKKENFLEIFRCHAWARVCRTALIRRKLFPYGRRFEDNATTPWLYWSSKQTLSLGFELVGYRQHPESILAKPLLKDISDIADTLKESNLMYMETNDIFWQNVSIRIFQLSCRRLVLLPFRYWPQCMRQIQDAIADLPASNEILKRMQLRFPLLYLLIHYIKNWFT
jgi:glycosyltransferase involved in cell wall biosynthesis